MAMQMPGGGGEDDDAAPMAEINVTPLVDVMLVLLIIFMVAAPMMTVGVPVRLPQANASRVPTPVQPITVTVIAPGEIYLQENRVEEAELPALLAQAREGQDPAPAVHLRGDKDVPYGEVLRVLGGLRGAGVDRVALVADPAPARR
ncbi:ExbD/TolR family protein [Siccirubricoccus sp. KC 17139]|uniref:ExbD/TolR family protein n=1 Tax=Siccirubricoccus soli TaxID=2899147 RepID=A0ABT1DCI1_9PROT|nr:ExbD/TolR family protein [Siccirubricoccus soli]MCO6419646.1 ExbD/TolR family protein [Siccirubricoccus soli]MCP2685781.1 ExbD/TolR family protein [Siccirubricoccus soli]